MDIPLAEKLRPKKPPSKLMISARIITTVLFFEIMIAETAGMMR